MLFFCGVAGSRLHPTPFLPPPLPNNRPFLVPCGGAAQVYSDAEVEYDDPSRVPEGACALPAEEFGEEGPRSPPQDAERDNETVALAALAALVSQMWTTVRQLQFRRADLEAQVEALEEDRRRAEEEAAEATAAAEALDE